jgi:hypothetical protein
LKAQFGMQNGIIDSAKLDISALTPKGGVADCATSATAVRTLKKARDRIINLVRACTAGHQRRRDLRQAAESLRIHSPSCRAPGWIGHAQSLARAARHRLSPPTWGAALFSARQPNGR